MLGLGDIFQQYLADLFWIDVRRDMYVQKGHECLLRFEHDLWRVVVRIDPKRLEVQERIQRIVHDYAAVVYLDVDDPRGDRSAQSQGNGRNDDEYAEYDLVEHKGQGRHGKRDNADGPVPIRVFFGMMPLRRIPDDDRFHAFNNSIFVLPLEL